MKKSIKNITTVIVTLLCMAVCAMPVQTQAAGKIILNYKNATMQVGSQLNLNAADGSEAKISQKLTWKSSNIKIATVNKNGIVKAKKTGTVTITAAGRNKKASCKIKVQKKTGSDTNILVAYFSCTNTTKGIAKKISKASGGDLYRITPAKAYTSGDLNYNSDNSRSSREQNNEECRPQMKGKTVDMGSYDVVFIGYPIWWGQAPKIISTFLESYDLSGKTMIPFCTSGSSGIGSSAAKLEGVCKGNPSWISGMRFSGSASDKEVENWVKSIGLPKEEMECQRDQRN